MRCTQYNHDFECAANNAQDKTYKEKTLGKTSANHEKTPRETMTATAMQAMCTNPVAINPDPRNPTTIRTTPDKTNQKPNLAIAANWPGKRISLPVMYVQNGKNHPEAELCPGIALTLKANQRIGIISLYAFFFYPISPRSRQDTKRDMRKQSI